MSYLKFRVVKESACKKEEGKPGGWIRVVHRCMQYGNYDLNGRIRIACSLSVSLEILLISDFKISIRNVEACNKDRGCGQDLDTGNPCSLSLTCQLS